MYESQPQQTVPLAFIMADILPIRRLTPNINHGLRRQQIPRIYPHTSGQKFDCSPLSHRKDNTDNTIMINVYKHCVKREGISIYLFLIELFSLILKLFI